MTIIENIILIATVVLTLRVILAQRLTISLKIVSRQGSRGHR